MEKIKKHILKFNVKIIFDYIKYVNLLVYPFKLSGEYNKYVTKSLIIATGASAKFLGIPSEEKFKGNGVSVCATCDGFFYRNKIVAIIGGGNTAVEEALYLSKIVSVIHIIHRKDSFSAEKILINRLMKKVIDGNIILHMSNILENIIGNNEGIQKIEILNILNKKNKILKISGLFIAIGHTPNTQLFKGQLKLKNGYIITKSGLHGNSTETNIPGVFAAGDVVDHVYRQAITSAGSGCMAAIDAEKYLNQK